jgi:RHS repeat-associated protein
LSNESESHLGAGWTNLYFAKLTRSGKDYHFRNPSGGIIKFPDPGDTVERQGIVRDLGSFHEIARRGQYLQVTKWNTEGTLTRYIFLPDRNGQWWPLRFVEDAVGNGVELAWDEKNRLKGLRQKLEKRTLAVAYSSAGFIASISYRFTDGRQQILAAYDYDTQGRLLSARDAMGFSERYEYDREGRLFREIAKDGGVFTYKYDDKSRCVRYSGLDNYDLKIIRYLDNVSWSEVTNSLGKTRRYEYLPTGQVIQEIDPLGGITRTEYDALGRRVGITDPMGGKTSFAYDEYGNETKVIDPLGNEVNRECNSMHLATRETDANGGCWERIHDDSNHLISATDPTGLCHALEYDPHGNLLCVKRSDGAISTRRYSKLGELIETTDWEGHSVTFERDGFGRIVRRTGSGGMETTYQFNILGRITSIRSGRGIEQRFEYDAAGNVIRRSDANGGSAIFRYGTCHRLLEKQIGPGLSVRYVWGSEPDRLVSVINERGEPYTFGYDACDRVSKETGFDGRAFLFNYNLSGQCVRRTNALGQIITWKYDPIGRLLEESMEGELPSVYQYDKVGNIISAQNGSGSILFERDALGRVVKEEQNGFCLERKLDANGNVVQLNTDAGHGVSYVNDWNGRASSINVNGMGTYSFARNSRNQVTALELPGDVRLNQSYDSRGRLLRQAVDNLTSPSESPGTLIQRTYAYDDSDMLHSIMDNSWGKSLYEHDASRRLVKFETNRHRIEYRLDPSGDPSSLVIDGQDGTAFTFHPGGVLISQGSFEFTYDDAGRMVSKFDRREGNPSRKWIYQWDAKDRLRSMTTPAGESWQYEYDPFGRRVLKKSLAGREIRFIWNEYSLLHEIEPGGQTRTWGFEPNSFRPLFKIQAGALYSIVNDHLGAPREMLDGKGKVVWTLLTDPWGGPLEGTGSLEDCPIRSQGQFFDSESGLHYNNFRYYDPGIGRFISQDPIRLNGGPSLSLYQYAHNPIHMVDPLGLCPPGEGDEEEPPPEPEKKPARITPGALNQAEENAVNATMKHIDDGTTPTGPTETRWGVPFRNRDGDLPGGQFENSPYKEYRVAAQPGQSGAGPNRVVVNTQTGEAYYTWTHYGDSGDPPFVQIR